MHPFDRLRWQLLNSEGVIATPTMGLPSSFVDRPIEGAKERRR